MEARAKTYTSVVSPAAEPDLSKLPPASKQQGVTFDKDIKPIFEVSCFRCHGDEKPKADLRLNSLESVLKGSEYGKIVVPGDSAKSKVVIAVAHLDEDMIMPPKPRPPRPNATAPQQPPPPPLTPEQIGLLRAWIDQGAK